MFRTKVHLAFLTVGLAVTVGALPASAADVTAASCAYAHVQAAVDAATDGTTVNVPAGQCTWGGTEDLVKVINKNITVRGAGIGRALVERCLERAHVVGAATVGIHTIRLLADAVRLYERLGFVRCPEFDLRAADVFPADGADDLTGLAFRLDLR